MAASFVLQGVLNEELFIQPAVSGEMYFLLAKVHPFLEELREKSGIRTSSETSRRSSCTPSLDENGCN